MAEISKFPDTPEEQIKWLEDQARYMTLFKAIAEEVGDQGGVADGQVAETSAKDDNYNEMIGDRLEAIDQATKELARVATRACLEALAQRQAVMADWDRTDLTRSIRNLDGDEGLEALARRDTSAAPAKRDPKNKTAFLGGATKKQVAITADMMIAWVSEVHAEHWDEVMKSSDCMFA